jgi:hypothetical protein
VNSDVEQARTPGIFQIFKSEDLPPHAGERGVSALKLENGAPGGIRTHDQLIKSQLLYQLSYRGNKLPEISSKNRIVNVE